MSKFMFWFIRNEETMVVGSIGLYVAGGIMVPIALFYTNLMIGGLALLLIATATAILYYGSTVVGLRQRITVMEHRKTQNRSDEVSTLHDRARRGW